MKLISLTLQNFCGIKGFTLETEGMNAALYGDNATGKTTVVNAFMWLFTGKNADGTADIDPQPLDENNGKIHNLETSAEALVEEDGEIRRTYRRVLAEVWTKKRGALTEELTGTKTSYYIDSVPMKESEYKAIVAGIAAPELFRMLSVVGYFPTTDWKTRRSILLEMCGDVTQEDVIASNPELAPLSEMLKNGEKTYTVEEFAKISKARKAELKKELDLIPARISENENAIPELKSTLPELTAEKERLERQLAELRALDANSDGAAVKAQQLAELKAETANAEAAYFAEAAAANSEINSKLLSLSDEREKIVSARSKNNVALANTRAEAQDKSVQREKLLARYREVDALSYSGGNLCPTCGQQLPPEQIEKAVAEFNRSKSEQLLEIRRLGEACGKEKIAELAALAEQLEENNKGYVQSLAELDAEMAELKASLRSADFRKTAEYAELQKKLSDLEAAPASDHSAEIKELSEQALRVQSYIGNYLVAENHKKRIAELTGQQKEYGAQYARCEQGEYLCDMFIKAKVSLLDERINSRFRTLKFKLFHQQQNGGIAEVCKVLIPCESGLVEYEKANNAAKINAGLELIDVLGAHYNTRLPVFVDNAESVTRLEKPENQLIELVVSAADKTLRTEHE